MRKENREVIGIDKIKSPKTKKIQLEVYATVAINIIVEDPEDDQGADEESLDKPEDQLWEERFGWAVSRQLESSTSREDFSDSEEWEELWEGR